jgi:hypothetical protein
MTQKKGNLIIEDKERPYLQETQEYIKSLKENLIKKILALQQNKKTGTNLNEFSQNTNDYTSEGVLPVTEEKMTL